MRLRLKERNIHKSEIWSQPLAFPTFRHIELEPYRQEVFKKARRINDLRDRFRYSTEKRHQIAHAKAMFRVARDTQHLLHCQLGKEKGRGCPAVGTWCHTALGLTISC